MTNLHDTITREEFLRQVANGNNPAPKRTKLCRCGKPFEPRGNRQEYCEACKPKRTARTPAGARAQRPAGEAPAPAPAARATDRPELWRLVKELRSNIIGVTIELHVGDVTIVIR